MRHPSTCTCFVALAALVLLLGGVLPTTAQQRALDHEGVLEWKTIDAPTLSPDGDWLAFVLTAMEGDPTLTLKTAAEDGPALTVRGTNPAFTSDSRHLVYTVPPPESEVEAMERDGKKDDELPKDTLEIADIAAVFVGDETRPSEVRDLGPVESYEVAREGSWVAYVPVQDEDDSDGFEEPQAETVTPEPAPASEASEGGSGEEDDSDDGKEDGSTLVLLNLATGGETRYERVADYDFADEAAVLAFTTSTRDASGDGAYVVSLDDVARRALLEGEGRYEQLAVSKDGAQVAFLTDREDVDADQPEFSLYHAGEPGWRAQSRGDSRTDGIPAGWWVSQHGEVRFSEGGALLHFGTAPRPEPEAEDETLDEDKVALDIWNWQDAYLQPMQLVQAEDERQRTYEAAVHLDGGAVVQLGTIDVPAVRFAADTDAAHALGVTDRPYRQLLSWDGRYNDLYAVDLASGRHRSIAEKVGRFARAAISPAGKYAAWWNGSERQWKVARLDGGEPLTASAEVPHPVWNELDDHPHDPPPYGSAGWTADDGAFLFYDRFDVWRFEPDSGRTVNLTAGKGRESNTRFRYARTEPELHYIPASSAESVGEFWFGQGAKCVIQSDFQCPGGAEPIRPFGDHSGLPVEAFDNATGELPPGSEPVQDQVAVRAHHAGNILHRFEPRAHRPSAPAVEELSGPVRRHVAPERLKVLLEQVGANRAQVATHQLRKPFRLPVGEILRTLEQEPAAVLEHRRPALGGELAGLGRAHFVDCLREVAHDVEAVEHLHRLPGAFGDHLQVGLPHVRAHEVQRRAACGAEPVEEALQCRGLAFASDPQQTLAVAVDLIDQRQVALPAAAR